MNKYVIKLLPKAYRDLEQIYTYVSDVLIEKEIALNLINEIEYIIFSLEEFPYRGSERKIGFYMNKGYRQIFCHKFSIIYRIDEEYQQVIIVTIKYSKSNF